MQIMGHHNGTTVYLAGPHWSPEEERSLQGMAGEIERHGYGSYLPHRDGIEDLYWRHCAGARPARREVGTEDLLRRALFCLELYQVVRRCGALVCSINGRVPDEGAVFKAALAFAVGKPLVICKGDNRSAFHGNDNSMVTGLTPAFKTVKRLSRVPAELAKTIRSLPAPPSVPGHLNGMLDLGERIWELVEKNRGGGEAALARRIVQLRTELVDATGGRGNNGKRAEGRVVYCSGPLFCPEELGAMSEIARELERAGCRTFLPQRDGVEAFVMNRIDSPLANAWIFKPLQNLVNRAVFALDIFQIVERCDSFVFNMNGRVPDEGGVVETAVAFALGRPLVVYNGDQRSLAAGRPHPMIVSAARTVVEDIRRIPAAVESAAGRAAADSAPYELPPQVKRTVNFGRNVWRVLGMIGFLRPRNSLLP